MGTHHESDQQKEIEKETQQQLAELQAEQAAQKRKAEEEEKAVIARSLGGMPPGNLPTTGGKP